MGAVRDNHKLVSLGAMISFTYRGKRGTLHSNGFLHQNAAKRSALRQCCSEGGPASQDPIASGSMEPKHRCRSLRIEVFRIAAHSWCGISWRSTQRHRSRFTRS